MIDGFVVTHHRRRRVESETLTRRIAARVNYVLARRVFHESAWAHAYMCALFSRLLFSLYPLADAQDLYHEDTLFYISMNKFNVRGISARLDARDGAVMNLVHA